ncbi:MAG: DUF6816 family protein [Elainellaceae cyanobacterium]
MPFFGVSLYIVTMRIIKAQQRLIWIGLLITLWLLCSGAAAYVPSDSPLSDRLQQFPVWTSKPPVKPAVGDLPYPDGFLGRWRVTTTLIDLAAPLAPDIITPGFEGNRPYLNQPTIFQARFVRSPISQATLVTLPVTPLHIVPLTRRPTPVVADRAFNSLNLMRAYLDQSSEESGSLVQQVKVDPEAPNRQVTLMKGDRQLVTTITGRVTETPSRDTFITSEVFQQMFLGVPQPYLNEVESTTAYTCAESCVVSEQDAALTHITADQVTAIYLSPQDPEFFAAGSQPVALYRYAMQFERLPE